MIEIDTSMLTLHCGGRPINMAELAAIPTPPKTTSYTPIPFMEIVQLLVARIYREFGSQVGLRMGMGVNAKGTRLFCAIAIMLHEMRNPMLGMRTSHDKSMSVGLAAGLHLFVCDNLAFSGDFLKYLRAHTGKAWEDLEMAILGSVAKLEMHFNAIDNEAMQLDNISLDQRDGYGFIGELIGERVLTIQQGTEAIDAWRKPRHAEFVPRSAWSLYQSVNQGLKQGQPMRLLQQYTGVHREMRNRFLTFSDQQIQDAERVEFELVEEEEEFEPIIGLA